MSIGHIAVRPHSRAQGHSTAAAVAYRCGLALTCERTGERHDFTRRAQRDDVAAYGLAGGHFESPAAFAAAVESAEKRRNSRICRDVQIALPIELDDPSRIQLAEAFAGELAERYGTATCWAVHRPDQRSDQRNHHAHIILPTRALTGDGCTFGKKLRILDDQRRGPLEITEIRQLWEARANEALLAAGQAATVHTGRTTNPEPTLSATHTAIERAAWKRRHPRQNQLPMSAAQLVFDDGICATRRGRALADHVAVRALGLTRTSRPVRALAPEAAQGLAHAVMVVAPVEEPRPVRVPAPEAAQGLAHAVAEVAPEWQPLAPEPIAVPRLRPVPAPPVVASGMQHERPVPAPACRPTPYPHLAGGSRPIGLLPTPAPAWEPARTRPRAVRAVDAPAPEHARPVPAPALGVPAPVPPWKAVRKWFRRLKTWWPWAGKPPRPGKAVKVEPPPLDLPRPRPASRIDPPRKRPPAPVPVFVFQPQARGSDPPVRRGIAPRPSRKRTTQPAYTPPVRTHGDWDYWH